MKIRGYSWFLFFTFFKNFAAWRLCTKKNVPATETAGTLTIIYELIYYRNYLRRRRDATNANAPKPASIPNADGSGTGEESVTVVTGIYCPSQLLIPFPLYVPHPPGIFVEKELVTDVPHEIAAA